MIQNVTASPRDAQAVLAMAVALGVASIVTKHHAVQVAVRMAMGTGMATVMECSYAVQETSAGFSIIRVQEFVIQIPVSGLMSAAVNGHFQGGNGLARMMKAFHAT